jgi:hypothetical protein
MGLMNESFVIYSKNDLFVRSCINKHIDIYDPKHIVCVYGGKSAPELNCDNYVRFRDYNDSTNVGYMSSIDFSDTLLIVHEMENMLGNRLDKGLDKIQVRHKIKYKIVIQRAPYIVDPWRFYFPYSCFDKSLLGYAHSYAIERDYNKYLEGDLSNPCNPVKIGKSCAPYTLIDYEDFFANIPTFEIIKVSEGIKSDYNRLKASLFENHSTIIPIMRELYDFARSSILFHNLPINFKKIYTDIGFNFICSDLPIDTYLANNIANIISHTNLLTRTLYAESIC